MNQEVFDDDVVVLVRNKFGLWVGGEPKDEKRNLVQNVDFLYLTAGSAIDVLLCDKFYELVSDIGQNAQDFLEKLWFLH